MPGYRCVMFWRSQNQGGNSCRQTRTCPHNNPSSEHYPKSRKLILSHYAESYQELIVLSSTCHVLHHDTIADLTAPAWARHAAPARQPRPAVASPPDVASINASCAKFLRRCMKAASRSSRPGLTENGVVVSESCLKLVKWDLEVNENILTRYMCQVGSTRLEAVHPLSKH